VQFGRVVDATVRLDKTGKASMGFVSFQTTDEGRFFHQINTRCQQVLTTSSTLPRKVEWHDSKLEFKEVESVPPPADAYEAG
jgi:ribosomal protein L24E